MSKTNKMIKYGNERNQTSWNGSSHTRGPLSDAKQLLRLNPADPSQAPAHNIGMMLQRCSEPGWKVTARSRDWKYLVELLWPRPRPRPLLIGPSVWNSTEMLLPVKAGSRFNTVTTGEQNVENTIESYFSH